MLNEEVFDNQDPKMQSVQIHRKRILRIIDRMIDKIEICLCLDDLLTMEEKNSMLSSLFSAQSIIKMNKLYSISKIKSGNLKFKKSPEVKSSKLIYSSGSGITQSTVYLHDNVISKLHHSATIRKEVKEEYIYRQPPHLLRFLKYIQKLRTYIHDMVNKNEIENLNYKKKISESWIKNDKYKKKLKNLQTICSNRSKDVLVINNKKITITNLKNHIHQLDENTIFRCENFVFNSEQTMENEVQKSKEKQNKLLEEANNVTRDYSTLLAKDLANEKKLRTKRFKVETVLSNWLTSYDTDIGELQKALEEEQEQYDKIKTKYDNLKEDYIIQTIQYNELMDEKKIEEQRIFDMKLYKIIATRSARIIQRWWRKIYARRHKKQGKKGKGKKRGKI